MLFHCEGCGFDHMVYTKPVEDNPNAPVWQFNGSMSKPTFKPSVKVHWPENGAPKVCHTFVTEGRIEYLSDCTHHLAGQTLELKDYENEKH